MKILHNAKEYRVEYEVDRAKRIAKVWLAPCDGSDEFVELSELDQDLQDHIIQAVEDLIENT